MGNSHKMSHKKRAMLEALRKSLGIVTQAAEIVGIDRRTHYRWMKEDEEYAEIANDISSIAVDFAESKLHKLIQDGNAVATIFYLKTKGKERGYTERQEVVTQQPVLQWG